MLLPAPLFVRVAMMFVPLGGELFAGLPTTQNHQQPNRSIFTPHFSIMQADKKNL